MKRRAWTCIWLTACWLAILPAQEREMSALFPELAGWLKNGSAETFVPENLYKYIDGAAENFLAYDFRCLAVQNYVNKEEQAISAEIYLHATPENAFGIYSSEKPLAGNYFSIGSQGYSEEGILNFICDAYYIKLNGFDLGPGGPELLKALAERIAHGIGGRNTLPGILGAFPAQGRVENSERFIAGNFMGHDFLRSAFTADYTLAGQKFQLFIMKAGDENEARARLQRYTALDKANTVPNVLPGDLLIHDPYNGTVQLRWRGKFIWGAVGQAPGAAAYLDVIELNLKELL